MDMESLTGYDWGKAAPELAIFMTAVLILLIDLFGARSRGRRLYEGTALIGVAVSLCILFLQMGSPVVTILHGTYRLDSFSIAFKMLMLIGTGFVLLMSFSYDRKGAILYRGEYYYLLLTALLGAMMLTSSADMITLFVSLELLSLSSYIMSGLRKNDLASNEAAFKYVVNGGIASSVMLFGMSYIYGLTGETNLYKISDALGGHGGLVSDDRYLLTFAFVFVFVGLTFKLHAVPFHMWAPDVYEGAPTPVTAFLSAISKMGGFAIVLRFLIISFDQASGVGNLTIDGSEYLILHNVGPYIAVLAALAMVIGNTAALRQHRIKRLFAYSSIAQAGYVLVPFVSLTSLTLADTWFYLMAYLFMNLGAFAVIQVVTEKSGSGEISSFSGLYARSPLMALAMAVFLISLAGIPFTAGFIGKFNIFVEAIGVKHYILASVMIATTVISYFYYFSIIVKMFLQPSIYSGKISFPIGAGIAVAICVVGTIGFGIFPGGALNFLHHYFQLSDFFQAE